LRWVLSRLRVLHAAACQAAADGGEGSRQSAIDVKDRRKAERASNLPNRSLVLEAKGEEQSIGRVEFIECLTQGALEIAAADGLVGVCSRVRSQLVGIQLFTEKTLESPSRPLLVLPVAVFTSRATVAGAYVIDDQPSNNDDQPRRELCTGFGSVGTEPATIVVAERFERMGVGVHRRVTIMGDGTTRVQHHLTVRRGKRRPGLLTLRVFRRVLKARQCQLEIGRT
jgi:hypothetical protein